MRSVIAFCFSEQSGNENEFKSYQDNVTDWQKAADS
jgi:hypothetical protein